MIKEIKTSEDNVLTVLTKKTLISVNDLIEVLSKYRGSNISICGFNKVALFCNKENGNILLDDIDYFVENMEDMKDIEL